MRQPVDELKNGPERRLRLARVAFGEGNYEEAMRQASEVIRIDPASVFAQDAARLQTDAQRRIDQMAAAKRTEEEARVADAARRRQAALKSLRKTHDDVEGVTWYHHVNSPEYRNQRDAFYLCFGVPDGQATPNPLWLVIEYVRSDWLFIQSYTIKADGMTFSLTPSAWNSVETDSGIRASGEEGVWEWWDSVLHDVAMIRTIANSKKAVIRYHGRQYHNDRTITAEEKNALRQVLEAYQALGGSL